MRAATKTLLAAVQRSGLDESLVRLSRVPLINRFVLSFCWQNNTENDWRELYKTWKRKFTETNISFTKADVLEIGAGNWGLGKEFLSDGVAHWVASDPRLQSATDISGRLETLSLDVAVFQPALEGHFDAVVSSAAMEHIPRAFISASIEHMARYLKPGGVMVHEIDLRDHVNVSNPHHFLKYSEKEWNLLTEGTIFYTNRLRSSEFKRLFAAQGMQAILWEEEHAALPSKFKVANEFTAFARDDLETTRIMCILKKDA